jgi:hypothetical protein
VAFTALGENRGVAQSDKLAPLSEHPNTLFPRFLGYFAGMIHISEYYHGVLPKVVWGTCVMGHLRDWNVSQDTIVSHFLDKDVWTGDVLLVVGGADVSELSLYPVAGCDDGADLEMFQGDMLELNHLFMGDVSCRSKVEVAVSLLVAFLVELGDPPASDQNDGMLG